MGYRVLPQPLPATTGQPHMNAMGMSNCHVVNGVPASSNFHPMRMNSRNGKNPRGILISPGRGAPQDLGISLQTILELRLEVPLFGVCMGLQSIGKAFGCGWF
ncbi:anthranilate synthase beta subunit 2, chloroplastic-like protein [Tanacetum coccineum]|uniref:Anthranilate synthase beta subunit 2, chloroplastic-like protein n=1 Tax=Tanacetum coccineum TaxID=301880 RepID=A0ABQ5ACD9_9ASTR